MMLGYVIQSYHQTDARGVSRIKMRRLHDGKLATRLVRDDEQIADQFDAAAKAFAESIDETHMIVGRALGAEGMRFYFVASAREVMDFSAPPGLLCECRGCDACPEDGCIQEHDIYNEKADAYLCSACEERVG